MPPDQIPGSKVYDDETTAQRAANGSKADYPKVVVKPDGQGGFYLSTGVTAPSGPPTIVTSENGQEWWKIPTGDGFRLQLKTGDAPSPTSADTDIVSQNTVGDSTVYKLRDGTTIREQKPKDPAERFTYRHDPNTGDYYRVSSTGEEKLISSPEIRSKLGPGDIETIAHWLMDDGRTVQFVRVGDAVHIMETPAGVDASQVGIDHVEEVTLDDGTSSGELLVVLKDGTSYRMSAPVADKTIKPEDVAIAGTPITLSDGSSIVQLNNGTQIRVAAEGDGTTPAEIFTDPDTGRTFIRQPNGVLQPLAAEPEKFTPGETIQTAGGNLVPVGPNQYQFIRDRETPIDFTPRESIPVTGGNLVEVAPNQYQFIRDEAPTFEPGTQTFGGREFFQDREGGLSELARLFDPGVTSVGDREFIQQPSGNLQELAERFDPELMQLQGLNLLQQRGGQINQLATPSMDDIITQALIDGEYGKAFAFQDFRDRPSASEAFATALAFARSPADQQIVSEIARGGSTVNQQPFDPSSPQRIGPQPGFLVDAFRDYQERTTAGRAPTAEESASLLDRFKVGLNPELDQQMRQREELHQLTLRERLLNLDRMEIDNQNALNFGTAKVEMEQGKLTKLFQPLRTSVQTTGPAAPLAIPPVPGSTPAPAATSAVTDQSGAAVSSAIPQVDSDAARTKAFDTMVAEQGFSPGGFGDPNFDFSTTLAGQHQARVKREALVRGAGLSPLGITGPGSQLDLAPLGLSGSTTPRDLENVQVRSTLGLDSFEHGGTTRGSNLEVVGEGGPELVDLPPGTQVTPLKNLSKKQVRQLKLRGVPGYQTGGITFGSTNLLPLGLRQLQSSRAITPPRGNLLRAANLVQPSAQALSNLTPESLDIFRDQAALAGIPPRALAQEMQLATPRGRRLNLGRLRPLSLRGIR